jgi:hypothetical protein
MLKATLTHTNTLASNFMPHSQLGKICSTVRRNFGGMLKAMLTYTTTLASNFMPVVGKNRFSSQQKFWWYDHHRTFIPNCNRLQGLCPTANIFPF